jgi:hypothetical protein
LKFERICCGVTSLTTEYKRANLIKITSLPKGIPAAVRRGFKQVN